LCSNGKDSYQKKRRKFDENFKVEFLKIIKLGRGITEDSRAMAYIFIFFPLLILY
jgi:hypothetical protein